MNLAPVAQFEGDVMQCLLLVAHEVDRMMIDAAAQEGEVVAHPVGDAKAQHIAVEARELLHIMDAVGDMAEFQRLNAAVLAVVRREIIFGMDLDQRALGVAEGDRVPDAGRNVRATVARQTVETQFCGKLAEIGARFHLKGKALQCALVGTAHEGDAFLTELGGEIGAILVAGHEGQANHLRPVGDLVFEIRG